MAEAITIQVTLSPSDIGAAGEKIARELQSAIQRGLNKVKGIGDNIGSGVTNVATKLEAQLTAIRERGLQQRQSIEAKRLADLDRVREQFAQREVERQRKLDQQVQRNQGTLAFFRRFSSTIREAGESIQQAGQAATTLLTRPLIDLGRAAVQSAVNIDRQVNVLKALTGSAELAEKRFAALVALSQKTPGLTTNLAATLDTQLRVAGASVQAIDKLLPVVGKLNAASPLEDATKFSRNLVQLINQNFERQDLKELVGQSPLAGELIKTLFNVSDPINSKAIQESAQRLGITTVDALASGLADAATKNPILANITESLGTQFEKLQDRVNVALRPLGLAIIRALTPLVEKAVPIIEKLAKAFDDLSPGTKQAILVIAGLTAAIGPLLIAFGSLLQTFGALGNIITVISGAGGIVGLTATFGTFATAAAPVLAIVLAITAALGLGYVAWSKYGASAEFASDKIQDVNGNLQETPGLLQSLGNDLKIIDGIFKDTFGTGILIDFNGFLQGTALEIAALKDLVELFNASFLSTIKTISLGLLGPLKNALSVVGIEIGILSSEVDRLSRETLAADQRFAEGFANVRATQNKIEIQNSLSKLSGEDQARAGLFLGETFGVPSGPNFVTRNFQAEVEARARETQNRGTRNTGGGGAKGAESQARAIRQAQLAEQKSFLEQNQKLLEDSNKRELDTIKFAYDEKLLSAQQYFENKTILEQRALRGAIEVTEEEIRNTQIARTATRAGTADRIRLDTELYELRVKLQLQSREFYRTEIDNIHETTRALLDDRKKLIDEMGKLSLTVPDEDLPSNRIAPNAPTAIQQRGIDRIAASAQAVQEFRIQDLELRGKELEIQNAINAGVISEAQGKEATLAIQRQYRDVLISQLEIQKQSLGLDQESIEKRAELNAQIEQLKGLGAELSPAQAFFKGLRQETETTAEAFERLGVTFRDSILDPINQGIDKLTAKFGIFKDVIGDILKLLARQVVNRLFGGGNAGGSGGFSLGGLLSGGSGGGGGFGSFATGGFAGGPGAGGILGGGGSGSGGGGSFLSQIFGGIGGFGGGGNPGGVPIFTQGSGGAIGTAGSGGALGGGLLGGLGAAGLLAGGGFLGQFAGGQSQVGRAVGGIGGSLLGGSLAAALFNPALLPALFSNPITAIVGAGLIGASALIGFFADREFNKFRKEVEKETQIKVDKKALGRELYKSEKALGEQMFGKGKFGKKIVDTIRSDQGQSLLVNYAEATGQENLAIVKNAQRLKEITDPFAAQNQFPVRRAFGGFVPFPDLGRDSVLTALRGREFVNTPEVVAREGIGAFSALQAGRATIVPMQSAAEGGFIQPSFRVASAPMQSSEGGGGWFGKAIQELLKMNLASNAEVIQWVRGLRAVAPRSIIQQAAQDDPDTFAAASAKGIQRGGPGGIELKREGQKTR